MFCQDVPRGGASLTPFVFTWGNLACNVAAYPYCVLRPQSQNPSKCHRHLCRGCLRVAPATAPTQDVCVRVSVCLCGARIHQMCRLSANNCALAQLAVEQKGSRFPVPGGGSFKRLGEPAQRDMSSILHSLKSQQQQNFKNSTQ